MPVKTEAIGKTYDPVTYAVGRGLEYYDAPAVRGIVEASAADQYRWSSAILALVKSAPFRIRRAGS